MSFYGGIIGRGENMYERRRIREERDLQYRAKGQARQQALRRRVLDAYGGNCACCGESEFAFLALDHIQGDGCFIRNFSTKSGYSLWRDLEIAHLAEGVWPPGFQVLCQNCNWAWTSQGICPHEQATKTALGRFRRDPVVKPRYWDGQPVKVRNGKIVA